MNKWKKIVAALRNDHGYKGDESLASVKQFVAQSKTDESEGIVFFEDGSDNPIDLDAVYKSCKPSPARVVISDDPVPPAKDATKNSTGNRAAQADAESYRKAAATVASGNWSHKSYNQRAAAGKTIFPDADMAEAFGAFYRYAGLKNLGYPQMSRDLEILESMGLKDHVSNVGTLGGFTVPEDFNRVLIDIRTNYGAFTPFLRRERQSQTTQTHMRQTGDLTVYQVSETQSSTASDMAFDRVQVTATKLGCRTFASNELINDSALNIADTAARNIVWSFEKRLEEVVVQGDGSSSYYGFTGFCGNSTTVGGAYRRAVEAGGGTWATDANKTNLSSVVLAAGNEFSEVLSIDLDSMAALAVNSNPRNAYFCSRPFYAQVFQRLAKAAGGATMTEFGGRMVPSWNGYPIIQVESMARTNVNSQVACLFGDPSRAGIVGEVGSFVIKSSTDRYIEQDEVVIVGFYRVGLNVHDVGNYNADATQHKAAPLVALAMRNA